MGHYLLPLFQFGFHSAEAPDFAPEGECEDLTRPPGLGFEKPSGVPIKTSQSSRPPVQEVVPDDVLRVPDFDSRSQRDIC